MSAFQRELIEGESSGWRKDVQPVWYLDRTSAGTCSLSLSVLPIRRFTENHEDWKRPPRSSGPTVISSDWRRQEVLV